MLRSMLRWLLLWWLLLDSCFLDDCFLDSCLLLWASKKLQLLQVILLILRKSRLRNDFFKNGCSLCSNSKLDRLFRLEYELGFGLQNISLIFNMVLMFLKYRSFWQSYIYNFYFLFHIKQLTTKCSHNITVNT